MTFSYPDFLSKGAALAAAGAAATAIQELAVHLPDLPAPQGSAAGGDSRTHEQRMDQLLASLWRMTDDLALIREEFRDPSEPGVIGAGALGAPPACADAGGEGRMDERASIIAQVNAVENSICAIVAELTGKEEPPAGGAGAAQFLDRVARHKAEVIRKSTESIHRLRLQAIQLAAAVQAYRASQSLASQAIDRIRNR